MIDDSRFRYGLMSRFFHWLMALLIVQQFFKLGDRIEEGEHWLGKTFGSYHGSIGLCLLVLVVLRLVWVLTRRQRPQAQGAAARLARIGHGALYLGMLAVPLSAVALMLGNGYGLRFFGHVLVVRSGEKIDWLASLGSLHSPLALLFLLLILGHLGAALYHHWVLRDDTLRRMTGG